MIIIITNERYVSFGNSHKHTHTYTQIHTIKRKILHTQTHIKTYYTYPLTHTHTKTHIHAEFMLQIKTNRHAYAPPLVFALQIHVHPNGFCVLTPFPYHMFPSKLSVPHNTHMHTHTYNILPIANDYQQSSICYGVRPSFTYPPSPYYSQMCCFCVGTYVYDFVVFHVHR